MGILILPLESQVLQLAVQPRHDFVVSHRQICRYIALGLRILRDI